MRKILLILQREYLTRVRKKSFLIITLLAPLGMVVLIGIQVLLITHGKDKAVIAVKDDSGYFSQDMRLQDSDMQNIFFKLEQQAVEDLKENYKEMGYDGILEIPEMRLEYPKKPTYFSDNLLGMGRKSYIEREMAAVLKNQRIKQQGIDKTFIDNLRKLRVEVKEEVEGKENDAISSTLASGVGGAMGFIMYIVILIYGTLVMRGVMEEKTNRISEIILSSAKPFQLMAGKIVGIGLVGLTQFALWILLGGFIYFLVGLFIGGSVDVPTDAMAEAPDMEELMLFWNEITAKVNALPLTSIIIAFLFYFLGGYLFYAALFAAIGSAVGDDSSDSQALVFPVTVPIIISFFILTAILEDPNSSLAFWSSIVPFSSSIIMPTRIAFGLPLLSVDFILSVITMIGGVTAVIWLAGRIYRVGILMTGKKANLKDLAKWMLRAN